MKNEALYQALKKVYGYVVIHNEGEGIILKELPAITPITKRQGLYIGSRNVDYGGEHYAVNCPFCGDTRQRLWLSYAWGAQMEYKGVMLKLSRGLAHCYNEHCLKDEGNRYLFYKSLEGEWRPDIEVTADMEQSYGDWTQFAQPLPPGYRMDDPQVPPYVHSYLWNRGFDPIELGKAWHLQVSVIPFYEQPVIVIPIYQQLRPAFWQARYIGDNIQEYLADGKPKPK